MSDRFQKPNLPDFFQGPVFDPFESRWQLNAILQRIQAAIQALEKRIEKLERYVFGK